MEENSLSSFRNSVTRFLKGLKKKDQCVFTVMIRKKKRGEKKGGGGGRIL